MQGDFGVLCPSPSSPGFLGGGSRQDADGWIWLLRVKGASRSAPLRRCFIQPGGAGKYRLGAKTPFLRPAQHPNPAFQEIVPTPQRTKLLFVRRCPQSCVYPSPPVLVCSKPAGFCPNPTLGPPPARHAGKGPAAPRKNQAGRSRRKRCPVSNATSPHVPILGRLWEPEGVAQLGGVPPYPGPPDPAVGGWFGLGGIQGGMDVQLLAPFLGVLWGCREAGGDRAAQRCVAPSRRGRQVWDSLL